MTSTTPVACDPDRRRSPDSDIRPSTSVLGEVVEDGRGDLVERPELLRGEQVDDVTPDDLDVVGRGGGDRGPAIVAGRSGTGPARRARDAPCGRDGG
jgi:hypothetical protein